MTPEIRTSIYIDHSYLAPKVIVSHGQPQTQTEWNTTPTKTIYPETALLVI